MTKVVSNKKQIEKLVSLMETNSDIAKGVCGKVLAKKRWEKFTLELNSLGPPIRTCDKWIKVWADLKCKIKKKKYENKTEIVATGGGPNRLNTFSSLEESVIGLLSINAVIDPPGLEFGLERENNTENQINANNAQAVEEPEEIFLVEDDNVMESDTVPSDFVTRSKNKNKIKKDKEDERIELLKKQTHVFQEFSKELKDTLENMNRKISSIEEYSKKNYYINKELLAIKKEKLKLYKEDVRSRQADRVAKLKQNRN